MLLSLQHTERSWPWYCLGGSSKAEGAAQSKGGTVTDRAAVQAYLFYGGGGRSGTAGGEVPAASRRACKVRLPALLFCPVASHVSVQAG